MLVNAILAMVAAAVATTPPAAARLLDVTLAPEWNVVAAGDIGSCGSTAAAQTAGLVERLTPDAVLTLGDNAYPTGSPDDFARCYAPTWGAFKSRTFPAPGNHDYYTSGASGYFEYFGRRAPGPFYSFNLGPWHLVSLNSEIAHGRYSPQVRWLRRNLARDNRHCELLYWHRPRWSGGTHGSDIGTAPVWRTAYNRGVDLVLVGHDHNYQRFYKLDGRGRVDRRYGVREIVAGTGGAESLYDVGTIANRARATSTTYGVVQLTLRSGSYDVRFVPVAGSSWSDTVVGTPCHRAPPR